MTFSGHMRKVMGGTAICLAGTVVAGDASAQSTAELRRQIEALKQQVQALEARVEETDRRVEEAEVGVETALETADAQPQWDWGPSPTFRTRDGRFSAHIRGRIQTDFAYINGNSNSNETFNAEFRRARLGIEGVAWTDWEYKLEIDFAGNEVDITDGYLAYGGVLEPAAIVVGQFKTPNSLEEQTSSRYLTFLERAAFTDAFNLNRRLGVGGFVNGDNWHVATGVFWQNTGVGDVTGDGPDAFGAVAVRGHYAVPLGEDDNWLHLGTSIRYRNCSNDIGDEDACGNGQVRYRQRPFFHATSIRHINTGTIEGVDSDFFWGPELALVYGPFSVQSEAGFLWGSRDENVGGTPAGGNFGPLWGTYAEVSYFLTGDRRNYDEGDGDFGRVKVNNPLFDGGWGAWQVAGRWDYLSLEDVENGIEGGEQWSLIGALNWYPNNHVRFMLDAAYTKVTGGSLDVNNGISGNNDIWGVAMRAQVDW